MIQMTMTFPMTETPTMSVNSRVQNISAVLLIELKILKVRKRTLSAIISKCKSRSSGEFDI